MGYSKVELANQALDHLGKDNIASLSEATTTARKANAAFDRTINAALSRSSWTFARKNEALAEVTNDWKERWLFKFDLPSDCLSPVRIIAQADIANYPAVPYEVQGGFLYTNQRDAKLNYVFSTNVTLSMPQEFLDAVSFLLARNLAMPLTRKMSMWNEMQGQYEYHLGMAIEADAGNEPTSWAAESGGYISDRGASGNNHNGASVDGSIYWE